MPLSWSASSKRNSMQLIVPNDIRLSLQQALKEAGRREIGGILMAEDRGGNTFRLREITIQKHGGSFAAFVRLVQDCLAPLQRFFRTTQHDYRKFNYLGEWHSHHSFALMPSMEDHSAMFGIVEDDQVGANFVVLLLVKLDASDSVVGAAFVYVRQNHPSFGEIIWEAAP